MTQEQLEKIMKRAGKGFIACSVEPIIRYKQHGDEKILSNEIKKNFKNPIDTFWERIGWVTEIIEANKHIEALKIIEKSHRVKKDFCDLARNSLQNLSCQNKAQS